MRTTYEAEPTDYAVPPGETLAEWLEEREMSQGQLAQRLDKSTKHVNQIINGVAPIVPSTALDLEFVTGISARFWLSREAAYREDLERLKRSMEIEHSFDWLQEIPLAELRRRGAVTGTLRDKASCVIEALRFFGVPSVGIWRDTYLQPQAAFRQSRAHEVSPGAVAAWLRFGQLEAERLDLPPFRAEALRAGLPTIRDLMRSGGDLGQAIIDACGQAGVVIASVPDVPGTRASGATHWMRGRPIVQLSLRGKTDDRFWFTLFHQLAHVLLHGRGEVFIESTGRRDDADTAAKEHEADQFAGRWLIPSAHAHRLSDLRSLEDVRRFAAEIGVSPGVVVGRLHHDRLRPWNWGAGLKARVDFVDEGTG